MTAPRETAPVLIALALLVVAGILGACSTPGPARFPHRAHLVRSDCGGAGQPECLRCNGCHTPSGTDRPHKLPDAAVCDRCHRDDRAAVHAVLRVTPDRRAGEIVFDHTRHLRFAGIQGQCVSCHAGVVKGGSTLPPMTECFTCHEHQAEWDRGQCTPCHARKDLARTMPRTFLKHEGSFARHHGDLAAQSGKLCQACHAQADCDDCHDVTQNLSIERRHPESVDRNFVHRGDFVVRHAMEAQSEPARCVRCHEPATCDACHVERGVSGNRVGGRSPHPFSWVGNERSGKSLHAREARRDIVLCAGCHEEGAATNCIRCHHVGGSGGNPHPGGWKSARSTGDEMCRYCHE